MLCIGKVQLAENSKAIQISDEIIKQWHWMFLSSDGLVGCSHVNRHLHHLISLEWLQLGLYKGVGFCTFSITSIFSRRSRSFPTSLWMWNRKRWCFCATDGTEGLMCSLIWMFLVWPMEPLNREGTHQGWLQSLLSGWVVSAGLCCYSEEWCRCLILACRIWPKSFLTCSRCLC